MTNRTSCIPRPGAGVLFGTQDTPACSNRTTNRTTPEREQDNEQDRAEQDTLHAHEQDNRRRSAYSYRWRRMVAAVIAAGARCAECGTDKNLEGDHELAVSRGGLSTRANLVIRCRLHNRRKGNRPPIRVQLTLDGFASTSRPYQGGVPADVAGRDRRGPALAALAHSARRN